VTKLWERPLSVAEAEFVARRYQALCERWRQRFPDQEPPPCGGDALERIRSVHLMIDRLRRAGVSQEEIVGLVRGPGMVVEDAELRKAREQAAQPPAPEDGDGDSGSR
jgi:hypothetical protein